jgi:hypothetical protein
LPPTSYADHPGTFGGGCGLDLGRFLEPGAVVELVADGIGVRTTVGPR